MVMIPSTRASLLVLAVTAIAAPPAAGRQESGPRRPPPPEVTLSSDPVSVPMESFGGRPVVSLKLEGKSPVPFVLDTGASGTGIAATLRKAQELSVIGRARVASPGSPTAVEADLVRIGLLEMGGARLSGLTTVALDMSGPFPGPGDPVGVLSASAFSGYLLTIDYPGQRVTVATGDLPAADGKTVFEFDASRRIPGLALSLAGTSVDVDMDTGSPGGIALPAEYAERLPLAGPP